MLNTELEFFKSNLEEWLKTHADRVVLIKESSLIGFFDTEEAAFAVGASQFGLSPFLIRRVSASDPTFQAPAYSLGLLSAVR